MKRPQLKRSDSRLGVPHGPHGHGGRDGRCQQKRRGP